MKWPKVIDWKFWLMLSLAMMVGYLVFVGYAAIEDGREKDRQNAALIRKLDDKDRQAERAAVAATDAAARSAANQAALLDYTKALADRQTALLAFLRRNGIDLPVKYVTTIPAPKVVKSSPRSRKAVPRRTAPRVDLPGKSERGKGKGKR